MYGTASSSLPTEFIQEVQVKTGGYEPEYGRTTGGQSIVITKSGGNEFHGDFFLYTTPIEGKRSSVVSGEDYPGTPYEEASYISQSKLIHNCKTLMKRPSSPNVLANPLAAKATTCSSSPQVTT